MTLAAPAGTRREKIAAFAADIKLAHSVFALPFALLAATLAVRSPSARWGWGSFALVVACMVSARTVAMAANRLLDAELDKLNPRTAKRAIPGGRLSRGYVAATAAAFAALFVLATAGFWLFYDNPLPLVLSLPVLAFLCGYPLMKRLTALCHYYLGAALGLAPLCAWVAITRDLTATPILLALAVMCWTAGFDVIYATVDRDSDLAHGVRSLPARLGLDGALLVSRLTHVLALLLLVGVGLSSPDLRWLWYAAVAVTGVLFAAQHAIVSPVDLSRVNVAFFTLNGVVSVLLGTAGVVDAALI